MNLNRNINDRRVMSLILTASPLRSLRLCVSFLLPL